MSYLVLARKYRPQSFDQVVGQQAVVRTLRNALSRQRVSHAMIFSGVRGVGKTTLARIMAKALCCETKTPDPPCNQCTSCLEITAGTAIDLHEIDGASNRGIQEIRELKENIRFLPTRGHYKIIIIDEVHMLTPEAFNALLKTLEEPPDHVIFMFATTELHKIPVTILSRCQRYELKRIPFADLFAFFSKIAKSEEVNISDAALELIALEAEGSVRDGLSLLDQIFSFADDNMTDKDVREVLGLVDRQVFTSLATALLAGELAACLEILEQIYGAGVDLKRFTTDLLSFIRAIIVCKTTKNPENLLDVSDRELDTLKAFAAANSAETLYRFFDILLKGIEEMQFSPHPRMVLEMTFIKALQTGQIVPVSELIGRIDGLLKNGEVAGPGKLAAPSALPAAPLVVESVTSSEPVADLSVAESRPMMPEAKKKAIPVVDNPGPDLDSPSLRDVRQDWDEFVEYVKDRKPWMSHIIRLCSGVRQEGVDLVLKFDDRSDCMVLQQSENIKFITEFAQDFFQQEMHVKIKIRGGGTGGEHDEAMDDPHEERRSLANDPLVQIASEIFGGQVSGIRTGPRSR
ncbi:MAG: DNA polymerase III subunit gamma/tau [Proteobacteria bacterium]|nr:DNA polymerase III subunit gamma/tau [Pseudomonadota bacterium]MBU1716765.1 DNA polymerase III subunit gamma/tau [Pseudomonadota bacterium]